MMMNELICPELFLGGLAISYGNEFKFRMPELLDG